MGWKNDFVDENSEAIEKNVMKSDFMNVFRCPAEWHVWRRVMF